MPHENQNLIYIDRWSNPATEAIYKSQFRGQPELQLQHENGDQCGGCAFFAAFNADWGLCCLADSPHHLETVFEHFTCKDFVREGWGPHSFTKDTEFHCRCGGAPSEYWANLIATIQKYETPQPRAVDDEERT